LWDIIQGVLEQGLGDPINARMVHCGLRADRMIFFRTLITGRNLPAEMLRPDALQIRFNLAPGLIG
jgi:hypothetical protein